ncbi:MAG TPA: hypothetical protein VLW85_18775 [Myxococcales bacterium]|nr:hypothetical protein [Myxococcales bacterium]
MHGWKRMLIALVCLGFAVLRIVFPDAQVDAVSVWLLAIAAAMFVLPEVQSVLPYIKRLRVGDTEIELVERLQREVARATESVAEKKLAADDSADELLREAGRSPEAALLLLSSKLEQKVRQRLMEAGMGEAQTLMSLPKLIELGVNRGLFSRSLDSAIQDFWQTRNAIAHGRAFNVPDSTLYSLISLGTQLLRAVSAA